MMHKRNLLIIPALIVAITASLVTLSVVEGSARENVKSSAGKTTPKPPSLLGVCGNPAAMTDLDVNNVRCRILNAGDLWWDYTTQVGKYEIPKNSNLYSIYAGALWVGGVDQGGMLRVAGQTYGHATGNNDFWPGPLDITDASIDDAVCNQYDKFFKVTRKEVETFVSTGTATSAITSWPGNGDVSKGQALGLAPFFDKDADGIYTPSAGDYPGFDLIAGDGYGDCQSSNCVPVDQLYGDQSIWWVFNDKGDIHAETSGAPIGLEVRAQAFGFFTDDEINNMTFYNYRIYNRSTFQLDTCYFGVWADCDLGDYLDDYVGCDVSRGLGYTYNGDNDDAVSASGYGANPPAVGIDFFRGPITNPATIPGDGIDNDRDSDSAGVCVQNSLSGVDEPCEQAIMSKFAYYTNGGVFPQADPANAVEYYNYLRGRWQNGTPFTYGGSGLGGTTLCDFCFPDKSDHQFEWGTGGNCQTPAAPQLDWNEVIAGFLPDDRRMMQSAGPFTLLPGAVNVVTTGVVWARATSGGAQASVKLLQVVDDKAQALFDNCFKVLDGPNAPDITIQELDKELILYLSNTDPNSNNYNETYTEFDPLISLIDSNGNSCPNVDKYYHFEGYKVYQLKNGTVSSSDLENPDLARLVYQCDLKNGIGAIINYEFDQALNGTIPKLKVTGADAGIAHSLKITTDAFAIGSPTLVNHKTYYFMAMAYGYNEFKKYQQDLLPTNSNMCDAASGALTGQKKPYKQGRKNILAYSAIPHIPAPGSGGTELHAEYGDTVVPINVTRIEGNGNGGNALDLTSATVSSILSSGIYSYLTPTNGLAKTLVYENGKSPIPNFKVVDPLNIPVLDGVTFTLWFVKDTFSSTTVDIANAKWKIKNGSTGEIISSDQSIKMGYEQLFTNWGLSINIQQVAEPGSAAANNNGFLDASMTDNSWLTGFADSDNPDYSNWIRSGAAAFVTGGFTGDNSTGALVDEEQNYEGVLGGTWAPYRLCAYNHVPSPPSPLDSNKYYGSPGGTSAMMNSSNCSNMYDLASVKVFFTSDKNNWTRCAVLETCDDSLFSENRIISGTPAPPDRGAIKLGKRRAPSLDKNGTPATIGSGPSTNPNDPNYINDWGMGWFPGYAVNLETGERLNICFGENSALTSSVGAIYYDTATLVLAFQPKEIVTGGTSGAIGVVVTDDGVGLMRIKNIGVTSFILGETITGGTSLASAVVTKFTRFEQNGRDMKWNPTSVKYAENPWDASGTGPVLGGMHFIYVFGNNRDSSSAISAPGRYNLNMPRYDAGFKIDSMLSLNGGFPLDNSITSPTSIKRKVFRDAMWVNIPILASGQSLLSSEVAVLLNVGKSYKKGYSPAYSAGIPAAGDTVYPDTASIAFGQNNNYPMYTFNLSTEGIATHTGDEDMAKEALDLIKVVPNPYYAFSSYETGRLDNRVKITNLPEVCTVSIYNLSGTLLRKFKKAESLTAHHTPKGFADPDNAYHDGSLDWDLKNTVGIPISSGVYIIHVEVPDVGEKIIKWFGIMRPIDLDSF